MKKLPYRFWIAVMIFFGAYTNFALRVNVVLSIQAMTKPIAAPNFDAVPECLLSKSNESNTKEEVNLPNYGTRFDWSQLIIGHSLNSYFWGYLVGSLPSGAIAERIGPFKVIFWFSLISAVLNALCVPAAYLHHNLFIIIRFMIGVLGTFMFPSFHILIAKWSPPLERCRFTSAMMGNGLAVVTNWPIISALTVNFGWSWGFYIVSFQLLLYCLVFWFLCSDLPEQNRLVSSDEVAYIKSSQMNSVSRKKQWAPYLSIISSRSFWILTICHMGCLYGFYIEITSLPKYMAEVIGYNLNTLSGPIGVFPHLFRIIVAIVSASIADWMAVKGFATVKGLRRVFTIFSHILPGLMTIGFAISYCNVVAVIFILVGLGINGTCVMTNLVNVQDLAPNFAGTLFGFISFFGGITGILVPMLQAFFIRNNNGLKEWSRYFYSGGVFYILSGTLFIVSGVFEEEPWNAIHE
ncbi:unnamed protein product [Phyllotreta striolata]|uniref:Major facilitator superfamily (MFS) profile domain-containing protein n=1 Tax=Phyllotreta striolata TaxID=444603 RepID=A0A9N9XJ11_PHYSR|nr:unnamed protein product [Phyllotreta striolata]